MKLRLFIPLFLSSVVLCGCNPSDGGGKTPINPPEPSAFNLDGEFTDEEYLKVEGSNVVDQNGKPVILRGINAGGYLVTERWMCATTLSEGSTYHLNLTEKLVERFGKEKTLEFWQTYRENFWTDYDFEVIKNTRMNVIRLPFSYMNVDPEFNNVPKKEGQEFNFDILDDFIERTASYHLYVILDLHGAYGSQNGQDHSGQTFSSADQVDFYSNQEKKDKTVKLWKALAEHYKDVNSIAAYDLLNEPGEKAGSTTTRHWAFFDDMYKAIRKIDTDRPLIMESCWDGANLPKPNEYNWENVIYSFHNYSSQYDDPQANLESFKNKLDGVNRQNFNVPFYMGEFTCYNNEQSWRLTLDYLNKANWHWTNWSYKINRTNYTSYGGWGIYFTHSPRIVVDIDSYEEIMEKLNYLDTNHDESELMAFDSSVSLQRVLQYYC